MQECGCTQVLCCIVTAQPAAWPTGCQAAASFWVWRALLAGLNAWQCPAGSKVVRSTCTCMQLTMPALLQVVFTRPAVPEAGQPVQVFYNPDVSNLRGRPEVWLRAGWNRCILQFVHA